MEIDSTVSGVSQSIRSLLLKKYKSSGFSTFTRTEQEAINNLFKTHPNNPTASIALGYVEWSEGRFNEASKRFSTALELASENLDVLKGFEIGITSWLPTGFDSSITSKSKLFFPKDDDICRICHANASHSRLTVLSSCDEVYFQSYGRTFLALAEREFANFNVHLHVMSPSLQTKMYLSNLKIDNVSVSIEENCEQPYRAYYASRRFLIAQAILSMYKTDLLITDIDVFPLWNFNHVISRLLNEDFDVASTKLENTWMPWNQYIVTQVLIRNSERSRQFLDHMAHYMESVYQKSGGFENIWWVDQNAMYYALQQGALLNNLKFQPIGYFGRLFFGSNTLGKEKFSVIASDYIDATDHSWRFIKPIGAFIDKYNSELSKDSMFLKRVALSNQLPPLSEQYDDVLKDFLLAKYIFDNLPNRFLDFLIAALLRKQSYGAALSIINKLRELKKPFPISTPKNVFDLSPQSENVLIEHIVDLLLRRGLDYSILAIADRYHGSSIQTREALQIAPIRVMLKAGAIEDATKTIKHSFSDGIVMVVGLQRSGTNYVAELLRLNTNAYIPHSNDSVIFWKHCFATEKTNARVNSIFTSPIDALNRLNARCLVVTKEPISWIESVTQRNPADFFTTRKQYVKNKEDIEGIAKFYRFFTESWKNITERVIFINYEAVLNDPNILFSPITGINRKTDHIEIPLSVEFSRNFDNARKGDYLEKKTSLGSNEIQLIRSILPDYFQ